MTRVETSLPVSRILGAHSHLVSRRRSVSLLALIRLAFQPQTALRSLVATWYAINSHGSF